MLCPDGRLLASGSADGTVRAGSLPQDWFALGCVRLTHHALLRDPASFSNDPEVVAAGKRAHKACQVVNRSAARAQRLGSSHGLAGLLAWASRLLP